MASLAIGNWPWNGKNPILSWVPRAITFAIYLVATGVFSWPLLRDLGTRLPSDPADPVFNASILWWNATTVPFSPQWWNAPHYYPSGNVAAFTETLVGLAPILDRNQRGWHVADIQVHAPPGR